MSQFTFLRREWAAVFEAETRDYYIDLLLKEAGWPFDQPRDREFDVSGMPNKFPVFATRGR
jgi:type I site-specific restriction endonuclease